MRRRHRIAGLWLVASFVAAPASAQMNPFAPPGVNRTQESMADAALPACLAGNLTGGLQDRCNAIAGEADDATRLEAVDTVSPEQIGGAGAEANRASGGQLTQIGDTLGARMTARMGGDTAALSSGLNGEWAALGIGRSGAAGSHDTSDAGGLGAFLNGTYQFGEVDSTFQAVGFDFDMGGITAGVDYVVGDTVVVGAAFSWMRSESNFDSNAGESESDSYNGSIFALVNPTPELYVSGIVTVGGIDYELHRDIVYTVTGDAVAASANSDTDGIQVSFASEIGYDYACDGFIASPYFGVEARRLDIDGYNETGGMGWAMAFDDQEIDSLTSQLGARVSHAISTDVGVLVPQIRGEWVHEYSDDDRDIAAVFVNDPARNRFNVSTENPDRDYGKVGADLALTLPGGMAGYLAYEALLGYDDVASHQLTLGGRIEF